MRKKIFLWITIILIVLALILGFENITTSQSFLLLFYQLELSMTLVVFLSVALGFLIGFFSMLYSYEKGREMREQEDGDAIASAPGTTVEKENPEVTEKEKEKEEEALVDQFDEDDEILE